MSDDDYTPSTDDVRTHYVGTVSDRATHPHEVERLRQFARWLRMHDESVRAEERERIARNIEEATEPDDADDAPHLWVRGMTDAARIAREGA